MVNDPERKAARDEERAGRAAARAARSGAVKRLDELPEVETVDGSPGDLIGLVTELTLAAWALRGAPLPTYGRADMPGRVIRTPNEQRG